MSACSWKAGAEENIVTIPSEGSGGSGNGGSSKSGNSPLSGGAIAGIVIGVVVAVILIAAAIIYLLRRERRKREFAAHDPPPDMAVITGPVYNQHSSRRTGRTGQTGKYYSPDTVGTSTDAGSSQQDNGTSNAESTVAEGGQQELDGQATEVRDTMTSSEDGAFAGQSHPATTLPNDQPAPVYHELGGKEISRDRSDTVSELGSLPPHFEREEGDGHLDSPFISTLGSAGWQDERASVSSKLVSPTTPTRRGSQAIEL